MVVALIPWNMPGLKSVGSVPLGTGAASYSARKIHYGLRDFVVGDQLSELRIIYRLPDALFP